MDRLSTPDQRWHDERVGTHPHTPISTALTYAARALRNTLIDLRRAEASIKRGGLRSRPTLDDQMAEAGRDDALDILALSEVVEALTAVHADQADVLVLRYFGGLTVAETSELVGRPLRTVSNGWAFACAWLKRYLSR